ncbi:hypothetical protein HDK90DRAFT_269792 [Phyllosticta capitalensis]|uniref:Uncharacterized protein n=1 Tax=Phyllosticta capitalensis TaxID=121624 RepID=A0ABR1YM00_9PEZI
MASTPESTSEVELVPLRKKPSVETIRTTSNAEETDATETTAWPAPRPLKSITSIWLQCLPDIVFGLIALAYFTYGIVCLYTAGETLHPEQKWTTGSILLRVSKFTPTIYPYLFAATIARCLKNVAKWRTEGGLTVGTMAQLLGSTTISNTAMIPWRLRSISPLMLALLLGWTLSPLGSQASLRIISTAPRTRDSNFILETFQTNLSFSEIPFSGYLSGRENRDLAFSAALAASNTTRNSSVDSWSNLFVPVIEEIEKASSHDSEGWYRKIDLDKVPHASLLGIPFTPEHLTYSASFTFVASYFHLSPLKYYVGRSLESYRNNSTPGNLTINGTASIAFSGWFKVPDDTDESSGPQTIFVDDEIYSDGGSVYIHADLILSWSFVEVQMAWDAASSTKPWHMTAVRRLKNTTNVDPHWTPLRDFSSFYDFFGSLVDISIIDTKSGIFEYYLNNPSDPFNSMGIRPNFTAISADQFCLRLAQLLNTFWMACATSTDSMGEINPFMKFYLPLVAATNASYHIPEDFLVCNRPWAEILIICSVFLMVACLVSAICSALSHGPDVLDIISSLTRDNTIDVPKGGTWMDGDERMRWLKDVILVMGDAKPDVDVGFIVMSNGAGGTNLDRKRCYE